MTPRPRRPAATLIALVLAVAGAGCGGSSSAPAEPAPATESADAQPLGRQIGGGGADAEQEATAAAVRFAEGYLRFQRGELALADLPGASRDLRRALAGIRIPPAQRQRRAEVAGATVDRLDASSARVTITIRNRDENLSYPLPLEMSRAGRRYTVDSTGDHQ